jgi:hypothetical protein
MTQNTDFEKSGLIRSSQINAIPTGNPVDTTAPLSFIEKDGYYVVDGKIFRNKIFAMQEATRKGLKPNDMTWVFNNNVYNNLDWKTPSNLSLAELYRLRAQQLREKYDYLLLAFSGGGDSTNVLDSFLLNNIHLDEIIVSWPHKQTSGKYTPSTSNDSKNYLSEWDYLIQPKLKWVEKNFPRTKINIVDPYENIDVEEPTEDVVTVTNRHNLIGIKRHRAFDRILLDRQTQYKNCAVIMGVNPPALARLNRHILTYFFDGAPISYSSDYTSQGLCRKVEFFYWTPDMPEIVRDQCHALLNNLRLKPELVDLLPTCTANGIRRNKTANVEVYRRWVKSVLYPTYDYTNLQVDKNTSPIAFPEWFSWFYDNPHAKEILVPHLSAITSVQNLIDPSFFIMRDGVIHEYSGYQSKLHYIGDYVQ